MRHLQLVVRRPRRLGDGGAGARLLLDATELPWEGRARRALGRGGRRHCSARRPQAESAEIANRWREVRQGLSASPCRQPRRSFATRHDGHSATATAGWARPALPNDAQAALHRDAADNGDHSRWHALSRRVGHADALEQNWLGGRRADLPVPAARRRQHSAVLRSLHRRDAHRPLRLHGSGAAHEGSEQRKDRRRLRRRLPAAAPAMPGVPLPARPLVAAEPDRAPRRRDRVGSGVGHLHLHRAARPSRDAAPGLPG